MSHHRPTPGTHCKKQSQELSPHLMLKDTVKGVAYYITGYEHPQKTVSAPGTAPTLLNAFHSSQVTLFSSSCLLGHLLPSSHLVSVCTKPSTWLLGPNLTLVLAYSFLICCPLGTGDTGDTFLKSARWRFYSAAWNWDPLYGISEFLSEKLQLLDQSPPRNSRPS